MGYKKHENQMKTRIVTPLLAALVLFMNGHAQSGLIAHYPFDGNANDVSGSGLNATTMGNPTLVSDRFGNPNSAYAFDGVDDYFDLGSSSILKPTSQVSLALWAYSDVWASFNSWAALAGNTSSGGYEIVVHGGTGVIESEVNRNSVYGIANYPLASLSSGWHHFAFTFDGRYNIFYVDGQPVDTDDAGAVYSISYTYPGNHTLIGAEAGSVGTEGDYFTGKIDDVRFFDRALSGSEINDLFDGFVAMDAHMDGVASMEIFPNPASDHVTIRYSGTAPLKANVTIVDVTGRAVDLPIESSSSANERLWRLQTEHLVPGVYVCKLTTGRECRDMKFVKLK